MQLGEMRGAGVSGAGIDADMAGMEDQTVLKVKRPLTVEQLTQ